MKKPGAVKKRKPPQAKKPGEKVPGAGRAPKHSSELMEKFISIVAKGNYESTAAAVCKINHSTVLDWKKQFPEFSAAVKAASEAAIQRNLEIILKAAEKSWPAAAWYLERKKWAKFGRRDRADITTKGKQLPAGQAVIIRFPSKDGAGPVEPPADPKK